MTLPQNNGHNNRQRIVNLAIAGIVGQVGCLTPVIILGAVFGGLWLDARFQTRPVITIVLLIASIPVSLVIMFAVVRAGIKRIRPQIDVPNQKGEEADIGKHT
jgi:MFS-type transporter involved in bile tolerance (Atg22 family)